jgi:superfamily I DNA and/or RNA helicase
MDQRRLNVAITRARHFLVIVGTKETLCHAKVWKDLLQEIQKSGKYHKVENDSFKF